MIERVLVYLDDDLPEYMAGIIRCGSVISEDEDGNETEHHELIDNEEFHSTVDLIRRLAKRLGVRDDIIEIYTDGEYITIDEALKYEENNTLMQKKYENLSSKSQPTYDEMKEWFFSKYEDPVESTPYNTKEGGYQYLNGGPYDAESELFSEFGAIADDETLQKVINDIEEHTLEWAKKRGAEWYDSIEDDSLIHTQENIQNQELNSLIPEKKIKQILNNIAENEAEVAFRNSGNPEEKRDEYIEDYLESFKIVVENSIISEKDNVRIDDNMFHSFIIPRNIGDKYVLDTYGLKRDSEYYFFVLAKDFVAFTYYQSGIHNNSKGSIYRKPLATKNEKSLITTFRSYTRDNPADFKVINDYIDFESWIRKGGAAFVDSEIANQHLPYLIKEAPYNDDGKCLIGLQKKSILWKYKDNYTLSGPLLNYLSFRNYVLKNSVENIREPISFTTGMNKTRRDSINASLNANEYAEVITKLFINADEDFNFALLGDWGRGKTFLMELVSQRLASKENNYETVFFNAWKYKTRPQVWAHLFKTVKGTSSFLSPISLLDNIISTIRFGIVKNGYPPFIILFITLILKTIPLLDKIKWLTEVFNWGSIVLTLSLAISVFRVVPKLLVIPSHNENLGLQEVIGKDLKDLIMSKCLNFWKEKWIGSLFTILLSFYFTNNFRI